jgi:transposase-like protein
MMHNIIVYGYIVSQHFLLSAAARTLSLKAIYKMGEDKAYEAFCNIRWESTDGEAVCPRCGCVGAYAITTRRNFKCKACHHQFAVTSGTIFASRKLDFSDLLTAICLFVNGDKGMSMLQTSRDLDVQYKTAFVLCYKLHEAIAMERHGVELDGEVEVDSMYVGGHIHPANHVENRVDRRKTEHQTGNRWVVVVRLLT